VLYSPLALKQIALYLDSLIGEGRLFVSQNDMSRASKALSGDAGVGSSTIGRLRKNRHNTEGVIANEPSAETLIALGELIPDPRTGLPFSQPRDLFRMATGEIPFTEGAKVEGDLAEFLRKEMVRLGVSPAQLAELLRMPESRLREIFAGATPNLIEILEMGRKLRDDGDSTPFFRLIGIDVNAPIKALNGSHKG
jgi:transcriptional regulator with XRE-family HTH domain